jgi:hypothetical protein
MSLGLLGTFSSQRRLYDATTTTHKTRRHTKWDTPRTGGSAVREDEEEELMRRTRREKEEEQVEKEQSLFGVVAAGTHENDLRRKYDEEAILVKYCLIIAFINKFSQ